MPIAMLTLGMSPEVTLDICVNLLDPVVQRLNNSIIQNGKAPSVDAIIKEVYANDPVTMNSLLKVYSFAQELRILTSFFKINQGVTAQYVELLSFYNSLSQSLPRLAKLQGNSKESPIELNQIFALDSNNPEVVNNTLQKFEQYKVGINAMDVIMKNENFFSMLQSLQSQFNMLQNISGAAAFVQSRYNKTLQDLRYDTNSYRKLVNLYQDYIVGKMLKSEQMSNIRFTVKDLTQNLHVESLNLPSNTALQFGLDTELGINNFMHVMDNYVIPQLKEKYKDNFFFNSLIETYSSALGKNIWQCQYDVFDDTNVAEAQKVQNAIGALSDVKNYLSGLTTSTGENLTIQDALYLYNMIATKGRLSSTSKVTDTVANGNHSRFSQLLNDFYVEYDKKLKNPEERERLMKEWDDYNIYQRALLNGNFASYDGVSVNLQGAYIWTFRQPTFAQTKLKDIIQNLNDKSGIKIKVTEPKVQDGNVVFDITLQGKHSNIRIPYTMVGKTNVSAAEYLDETTQNDLIHRVTNAAQVLRMENEQIPLDQKSIIWINKSKRESPLVKITETLKSKANIRGLFTISSNNIITSRDGFVTRNSYGNTLYIKPKNYYSYDLLDLYLQAQFDHDPTIVEKATALKEVLSEKDKKIGQEYLQYMQEHYPEQEFLQAAEDVLHRFEKFTSNKELFYRPATKLEQTKKSTSLMVGDLVTSSEIEYLYIGKINDQFAFIRPNLTVEDGLIYRTTNLGDVELTNKLRVDESFNIQETFPRNYQPVQTGNTEQYLTPGDRIFIGKEAYKVYGTLYTKEDDITKVSYIVNKDNRLTEIPAELITGYQQQVVTIVDSGSSKNEYKIPKNSYLFTQLTKFLKRGDIIVSNNAEYNFIQTVSNDSFIATTQDGTIATLSFVDIDSVKSDRPLIVDNDFISDIQPLGFFTKHNSLYDISKLKQRASLQGLDISMQKGTRATDFRGMHYLYNHDQLQLRLDGYSVLNNSKQINIGDVFIKYTNDSITAIKVLEQNKKGYCVAIRTINPTTRKVNPIQNITEYTNDDFVEMQHYTKNENALRAEMQAKSIENIKQTTGYEPTPLQKSNQILEYLQNKYNVKIMVDENLSTAAMLRDGVIYVKNPDTAAQESLHEMTHLAMAALRMTNPDFYYSMRNNFMTRILPQYNDNTVIQEMIKEVQTDTEHYQSIGEQEDEIMIRFSDIINEDARKRSDLEAKEYVDNVFSKAFEFLIGSNVSYTATTSFGSLILDAKETFTEALDNIDILKLKKEQQMRKIMNNIKEICK